MLDELAQRPVGDIARREPIVVGEELPVQQALERMREGVQGALLVRDEQGCLCGIFTERDVLLKLGTDAGLLAQPIRTLMTPRPESIRADQSLGAALHRMKEGPFRHLPIVDEDERPVGILSIRDVLALVAENFPKEILNLPPVPQRGPSRLDGG